MNSRSYQLLNRIKEISSATGISTLKSPGLQEEVTGVNKLGQLFKKRFKEADGKLINATDTVDLVSRLEIELEALDRRRVRYVSLESLFPGLGQELDRKLGLQELPSIKKSQMIEVLSELEAILLPGFYLLADTGSIVHPCSERFSRLWTILPERLFILSKSSCLLPELKDLLALPDLRGQNIMITTGPSRTADIEKKLILGVHGPVEVKLFLMEDE